MSDQFDPYDSWLAIPPKDQPPNHYRLLGVELFEENPNVIQTAADQRMVYLRTFQIGKHSADSQKLLNEVAAAKVCLLNAARKAAYDERLRQELQRAPRKLRQQPPPPSPLRRNSPSDSDRPKAEWRALSTRLSGTIHSPQHVASQGNRNPSRPC